MAGCFSGFDMSQRIAVRVVDHDCGSDEVEWLRLSRAVYWCALCTVCWSSKGVKNITSLGTMHEIYGVLVLGDGYCCNGRLYIGQGQCAVHGRDTFLAIDGNIL